MREDGLEYGLVGGDLGGEGAGEVEGEVVKGLGGVVSSMTSWVRGSLMVSLCIRGIEKCLHRKSRDVARIRTYQRKSLPSRDVSFPEGQVKVDSNAEAARGVY